MNNWFIDNLRSRVSGGGVNIDTGAIADLVAATMAYERTCAAIVRGRLGQTPVAEITVNIFDGQLLDVAEKLAVELR